MRDHPRAPKRAPVWAALAAAGLSAAAARAESPPPALSLADCLQLAVRDNPLIRAAEREVDLAEAERAAMNGKLYPTISARLLAGPTSAAHGNAIESTTPVNDYSTMVKNLGPFFRAEVTIVQPLYTFGKVATAEEALGEAAAARENQVLSRKWEVVTQVKSLYFALLLTYDLLKLVDEIQGNVDQAKQYLEEHLANDEGDVTPIDRAKLTAYDAELKVQRIEVVTRQKVIRDGLTRLMGRDPAEAWRPRDEELSVVGPTEVAPDTLVDSATERFPDLAALTRGVRALELKEKALRSRYYPDLFLVGGLRYGVAPNRDVQSSPFAVDNFNFFGVGAALGLSWDWQTGVAGAEVAMAAAELEGMRETRRALLERVRHDVVAAGDELSAAHDKIEATKEAYKSTRTWSLFAMNGFELGTVSAKDLIDGLAAFVKARFTLLQLTYEYNVALARLSQAAARELVPELGAGVWQ